jgi:hypothetical protein
MHAESSIESRDIAPGLGGGRWGGCRRPILTELTAASVRRALVLRRSVLPRSVQSAVPVSGNTWAEGTRQKWCRSNQLTDLVEDLLRRVWECHRFLEDLSHPVQTLTFRPVVESARHVDLFRVMGPVMPFKNQWLADWPSGQSSMRQISVAIVSGSAGAQAGRRQSCTKRSMPG